VVATVCEMQFVPTGIEGVVIIDWEPHRDHRGAFARTFCTDEFDAHGLPTSFPQCNLSINDRAGTLRGLHFNQSPHGESKLVRCVRGAIHDVVVDLRQDSPTRFRHVAVELTADNHRALFMPADMAHGFVTLEDDTDVYYHMGSAYVPGVARGLRWDDPSLAVEWPLAPTVMSDADATYPDLDPESFDLSRPRV
jgi:dTDP-4-dehydrorhamnose 3,5-epimerase